MRVLLLRLLAGATPVIAILVAAAFILPPSFPWLPRQLLLAAIGIGGIALVEVVIFRTSPDDLGRRLGFVRPDRRTIYVSLAAGLPMWLFLPLVALTTGTPLHAAFLVFGDPSNGGLLILHMLVVLVSIYATLLFRHPTVLAAASGAAAPAPR